MFPTSVTETTKGGRFLVIHGSSGVYPSWQGEMMPVYALWQGGHGGAELLTPPQPGRRRMKKGGKERGQSKMSIQLPVMFFVLPITSPSAFPTSEYRYDSMKLRRN